VTDDRPESDRPVADRAVADRAMADRAGADRPDIETIGTRIVYQNRWMRVREDAIRRRDGSTGIYGVVDKGPFVVVVPMHADGSFTLVQQFRYPVSGRFWEFCQGMWGPRDTDLAVAAGHELEEECGLVAEALTPVGDLFCAYGTMRQPYRIFLATGLTEVAARPETEEQDLVSRRFPRAEVERMLREGEIKDDTTLAAWALLMLKGFV
jgi:ADP-ribose pyrophosphatase